MATDPVDEMIRAWARRDPDVDASPLEVVGRLLLCAHDLQNALVAALAPFELSYGDFDVINTLRRRADPGGTNPRELASASLVTSGAMTARLDRLERVKLIKRMPDPGDRRGVRVHLTEQGERRAKHALAAVIAADEAFLQPLDPEQRKHAATLLKLLLLRGQGGRAPSATTTEQVASARAVP